MRTSAKRGNYWATIRPTTWMPDSPKRWIGTWSILKNRKRRTRRLVVELLQIQQRRRRKTLNRHLQMMGRSNFLLISLSVICFTFGCAGHSSGVKSGVGVESEKQKWVQLGWSYVETVGAPADDAKYAYQLTSPTARTVTAFASSGNSSTSRSYDQRASLYLIVTMQRPGGDTFALVFERPKP